MSVPQTKKWTTRSAPVLLLALVIGLGAAAAPASAITVTSDGSGISVFDELDEPNVLTVIRDGTDLLLTDTTRRRAG